MNRSQIDDRKTELASEATDILNRATGPLADEDRARLEQIETELEDVKLLERAAVNFTAGAIEGSDSNVNNRGPEIMKRVDPWEGGNLHRAEGADLKSRTLTAVERMGGDNKAREAATVTVEANGPDVARHVLCASQPSYVSAFNRILQDPTHGHLRWTAEEAAAFRDVAELQERIGSTSDAAGGYLVPSFLDPAITLTSSGVRNPFRQISRNVVLSHGNVWQGVISAGTTMSFDTEGSEVSDDFPALDRVSIPVFRLAGAIFGSWEILQDAEELASEAGRLIRDSYDTVTGQAFVSGNGTTAPQGVVTALYPISSRWSTHGTNSVFTTTDLMNTQQALAPRFQPNASWISSLTYANRVRAFGTDDYYGQTVDLSQAVSGSILGRPSYEASDMSTALNTVTQTCFVYGDFSNYLVVDRLGLTLSYVPHLFGGSGRPTGQGGWYAFARVGAEVVNNTAFVLSVNPGA